MKAPSVELREKIYNFILRSGAAGVTDADICKAFNVAGDSERPRRNELVKLKLVGDSGKRRILSTGRTATVWKSTKVLEKLANNLKTAKK